MTDSSPCLASSRCLCPVSHVFHLWRRYLIALLQWSCEKWTPELWGIRTATMMGALSARRLCLTIMERYGPVCEAVGVIRVCVCVCVCVCVWSTSIEFQWILVFFLLFCLQITSEFAQRLSGKINELLAVMENGLKSADPKDCTSYTGWAGDDTVTPPGFKRGDVVWSEKALYMCAYESPPTSLFMAYI